MRERDTWGTDVFLPKLAELTGKGRAESPIIYHYTSISSMLGIAGCDPHKEQKWGAWRAGAVASLNDEGELNYGLDLVKSQVVRQSDLVSKIIVRILRIIDKLLDKIANTLFCASFTAKPDDIYQWLMYADSGNGVAIGVDREALEQGCNAFGLWVLYDRPSQIQLINEMLEVIRDHYQEGISLDGEDSSPPEGLIIIILYLALAVKHSAFAGEEEYRLVTGFDTKDMDIWFRVGGSLITSYVELTMRDNGSFPVREIKAGPKTKRQSDVESLGHFCHRNKPLNGRITVSRSEIPLRRM